MALLAQVGTFTSPSSTTGNQTISLDSGIWAGASPKLVIIWAAGLISDTFTDTATVVFGAAVSSSKRAAVTARSWDNQSTSNAARRHSNTKVITYQDNPSTVLEEADLVSFGANQFTVNWTTSHANAYIYNFIALGGDELEADIIEGTLPTSATTKQFGHSLSGAPTAGVLFSMNNGTAPAASLAHAILSLGVWDGTTEHSSHFLSEDGQATSDTYRAQTTKIWAASDLTGSVAFEATVDSADASNITLDATGSPNGQYFWMILLRGCQSAVVLDTQKTSTGSKTTSIGFPPKVGLITHVGATSSASIQSHAKLGIGALDASGNQSFVGLGDNDNVGTTETDRIQDSDEVIKFFNVGTPTITAAATGSFSGNDLSLNWTTADATAREFGGLFLGDQAGLWPHHLDNQGLTGGLSQLGI